MSVQEYPLESTSTHGNSSSLLVDVKDLLLSGRVEALDSSSLAVSSSRAECLCALLSNRSREDSVVVFLELGGNTSGLVDLSSLGNHSSGLFVEFTRNSLVLAYNLAADSVVERGEEVEEFGRDSLLV